MKLFKVASLALTFAALVVTGGAARAQNIDTSAGIYHVGNSRGPIRQADLSPFKGEVSSEILAGPTSGLDSAWIVYSRRAAGARQTDLFTLSVEHTYMVLSGKLNVQLGTDQFVASPETLVLVPAGVPHRVWNAGTNPEVDLEVITPSPSRDLASLMKPAEARKVEDAAKYIRVAPPLGKLAGGTGHESLNERILADRSTGSEPVLERLNDVVQGGGRTSSHIHPFDQAYFIRRGTMTVEYGLAIYQAPANSLVVLPTGVVHNNTNDSPEENGYVTLLIPDRTPRGSDVEVKNPPKR